MSASNGLRSKRLRRCPDFPVCAGGFRRRREICRARSRALSPTTSSISAPSPACATAWKIPAPTPTATSWASPACSRRVAAPGPSTSSLPPAAALYGAGATSPFREDADTGPAHIVLRCDQEGQRTPRHSYARTHGLNVTGLRFRRLRPVGTARHGADALRSRDQRRPTAQTFNQGNNLRRFHLRGRHRRRRRDEGSALPADRAPPRHAHLQPRAQPAHEDRASCACWKNSSAKRPSSNSSHLNSATCWKPAPTSPPVQAAVGFAPKVPLEEGLPPIRRMVPQLLNSLTPAFAASAAGFTSILSMKTICCHGLKYS